MELFKHTAGYDRLGARLAEHHMRQRTLALEVDGRKERQSSIARQGREIHPCIAISRETGSQGAVIARRLGDRLGLDVLHREILDDMSRRCGFSRTMLDLADERASNWTGDIFDVFGKWLDKQVVTQSEYILQLRRVMLAAARHASSVLVGRGAQFLLPREKSLTVYVVSPLEMRIEYVCRSRNCSAVEARRYIRDTDQQRRYFVKKYFHREIGDPHLYDVVVNRAHTSVDTAAELIANLWQKRFAGN